MRSVFALVAVVATVSVSFGCASEPPPPPPVMPAPPPPTVEPVVTAPEPPRAPEKKLVSITTKSPDAKAALLRAWDLSDNNRNEEALEQCRKALAADPDFALGHTCVGSLTSGVAGQAEMDTGVRLSAQLPEAERLYIDSNAALRRQETGKYYADLKRVAEVAPDDFHAFEWLGWSLNDRRDFAGCEAAFRRVLELNPGASFAHGWLTWVFTEQRKYDEALASARKYVEGAPGEAGAHQALGAALLNVNQAKEADAELTKAVAAGPKARSAYYDLATVKAIAGDFAGARDVLEKSKVSEVQPTDALERTSMVAWALFGEGKVGEAFSVLDAAEKDADEHRLPWPAFQAAVRAWALWGLGKPVDALRAVEAGLARCDSRAESSEIYKGSCRRDLLTTKAFAQVRAGRIGDAQKTVAQLRDEAKKWPDNVWLQTDVDMLSDQVAALANKDGKAAEAVLAKCPPDSFFWKFSVLKQAEKSGDRAGAEDVRKDLLGRPVKDIAYPFFARMAKK
jgi:Flp pilus assembly protein TadD